MKFWTASWKATVAAAAIVALPVTASAQTPPPTQPPATAQPATPPADTAQATPAAQGSAQDHLRQAKAALDDVATANLSARARSQVADLKKRLNALERAVASNDEASATGTAARSTQATRGARGKVNWGTEVAAMDKTLTALLGPSTATTGTAGAAATTGNKAATAVTLDEATKAKLTEFRTHLTAFATAMAKPAGDAEAAPASPAPTPSAPTPQNPPTPTPQNPPTEPAQPPAQQQAAPPAAQNPSAPKVDPEAARKHLSEARNTLSQLTQLPAAGQLSGEARTQVSQLITNFNELITTQSEWRASYAKVSANLTSLLGPEAGSAEPSATGTAGAVGTSGAGMTLDPAVRAKLAEMRKHLAEFEKASGGTEAPAAASSQPSTPPDAAPPATTPPAATPPPTAAPAPAQGASSDPLTHLAAIEAVLKLQGEGGGLTLDKAQVDLLRTHIAELRKLLEKK